MKKLFLFLLLSVFLFAENPYVVQNRFNGGELSPLMNPRTDFDKYYSGCHTLENLLVLPQGGVAKRPGTYYVASTKSNGQARLIPFIASVSEAYVLEFGDQYIRFYSNGQQIESGGAAYELVSPYQAEQLDDIKYVHSNDVTYFLHPNFNPYKLSRYSDTSWTMETVDWTHIPYRSTETDRKSIKATFVPGSVTVWTSTTEYEFGDMVYIAGTHDASDRWYLTCIIDHTAAASNQPDEDDFDVANPPVGDGAGEANQYWYAYCFYDDSTTTYYPVSHIERGAPVSLAVETGSVFESGMIGSTFRLRQSPPETVNEYEDLATATADPIYYSDPFRVYGDWTMTTTGAWYGDLTIQRSYDYGNSWQDVRNLKSVSGTAQNYNVSGTESLDDVFYRMMFDASGVGKIAYEFHVTDNEDDGEVLIGSIDTGGGTIPDGSNFSSYTDCVAHYKLNDASAAWVDGSLLGSYASIVAHYLCDDNAANSTVTDSSGNAYNGTVYSGVSGSETTNDVDDTVNYKVTTGVPASFDFEATATMHNFECPTGVITALGNGSRSVNMWVKPESSTSVRTLFTFNDGSTIQNAYVYNNSGQLSLSVNRTAGSGYEERAIGALPNNEWKMITYSYDSSTGEHLVYLNGMIVIDRIEAIADWSGRMLVGGSWTGAATKGYYFDGNIDNVLVYSDVLTQEEVVDLYSAGKVTDSTSNDYHAALEDDNETGNTDSVDSATYKVGESDTVSFDFDTAGNSYNVECPDTVTDALGAGSRTVAMWIRPESFSDHNACFTINSDTAGYVRAGVLLNSSANLELYVNNASVQTGSTTLIADEWNFLIWTYNATSSVHRVEVNGVLDITHTLSVTSINLSDTVIGAGRTNLYTKTDFFDGNIDNVLFYNRVLSGLEIVNLYSATATAYGTVVSPVFDNYETFDASSDYTDNWSESAWNENRGYPSCGCFYEQRLCLASTDSDAQTVWMSKTDDYENFKEGTLDDDSIAYTIAARQNNKILWLSPQSRLGIGTTGGEFVMSASSIDEAVTPSNVKVTRQSTYGSDGEQSIVINDATLFLQRNRKRVREFVYNYEKDSFVSPDMTILAEHITGDGVSELSSQQSPNTVLWSVRDDGQLLGFTYERSHDITAWHRHILDGTVESNTVIPGSSEDEVWLIVNRYINGNTVRYIERFLVKNTTDSDNDYFVDCGIQTSVSNVGTISSGLDHLEGKVVAVVADGEVLYNGSGSDADFTVTSGEITLNSEPTETESIDLTDEILVFYKMNENEAADTAVADSSGNGLNGVATDFTDQFFTAHSGSPTGLGAGSFTFNEPDGDQVDITDDGTLDLGTSDFSICAWIKTSDTSNNWRRIFSSSISGSAYSLRVYLRDSADDELRLGYPTSSSTGSAISPLSPMTVTDDQWHFVVVNVDRSASGTVNFYVDNILDGAVSWASGYNASQNFNINTMSIGYKWTGSIDNMQVFNRLLTENEISFLHSAGEGTESLTGEVTTGYPSYSKVYVGLLYTPVLKTMPLSSPQSVMHMRQKRISEVKVEYYSSGDFYIGKSSTINELVGLTDLETGYTRKTFPPGYDQYGQVYIYQSSPEPLTILSLGMEFQVQ